jgi:hypothetical protein
MVGSAGTLSIAADEAPPALEPATATAGAPAGVVELDFDLDLNKLRT